MKLAQLVLEKVNHKIRLNILKEKVYSKVKVKDNIFSMTLFEGLAQQNKGKL